MKLQEILMESLAQGYCVEPNLNKVLDAHLIESQVKLALEKINKAYWLRKRRKVK